MNKKVSWLIRRYVNAIIFLFKQNVIDIFPIKNHLKKYNTQMLYKDSISGFSVSLLAFPQGMAYAAIADLPIQYGIISSAIATIIAPLFLSSKYTMLGPTNATAFMFFSSFTIFTYDEKLIYLPILMILIGVILILSALLRVAEFVQYISRSVIIGYMTAAAVLIMTNQFKHSLGIDFQSNGVSESPKTFFTIFIALIKNIGSIKWEAFFLSLITLLIWIFIKSKFKRIPAFAFTLILGSLFYVFFNKYSGWELSTFESFKISELKPKLSSFTQKGVLNNISNLIGIAFPIAFLASLENSVMSKTLASKSGDRPNVNQDMFSLGVSNLSLSVTGGMPVSGSITRSSLNFSSGATSPISSIICGVLCTVGLLLLGNYMEYIPKAVLASLVICISISIINLHHIKVSLFSTTSDAAVLIITIISSLMMPLNIAIFLGVGMSIIFYLRAASRPELKEYEFSTEGELKESNKIHNVESEISIVHVEGNLFFAASEMFRNQIQENFLNKNLKVIIIRLKNARHFDATAVLSLEDLVKSLHLNNKHLIISGASKEIFRILKNSGILELIGRDNFFLNIRKNPNLSTRNALKRAQQILGKKDAEISIYYNYKK